MSVTATICSVTEEAAKEKEVAEEDKVQEADFLAADSQEEEVAASGEEVAFKG